MPKNNIKKKDIALQKEEAVLLASIAADALNPGTPWRG
jgi:hypothetical protein